MYRWWRCDAIIGKMRIPYGVITAFEGYFCWLMHVTNDRSFFERTIGSDHMPGASRMHNHAPLQEKR